MNPARRMRVIAPLFSLGIMAASIFGSATPASACSSAICLLKPDLTVGLSASPNPAVAGGTHTYAVTVTNTTWSVPFSPLFAPRPVAGADVSNVRVHLSAFPSDEFLVSSHDDTGTGFVCYAYAVGAPDTMDTRCVSGYVATGTTAHITLTMHAPSKTGAHSTTATVDPFNEIAESNENNNTATVGFSVS
jgi:hypothetical protein